MKKNSYVDPEEIMKKKWFSEEEIKNKVLELKNKGYKYPEAKALELLFGDE